MSFDDQPEEHVAYGLQLNVMIETKSGSLISDVYHIWFNDEELCCEFAQDESAFEQLKEKLIGQSAYDDQSGEPLGTIVQVFRGF